MNRTELSGRASGTDRARRRVGSPTSTLLLALAALGPVLHAAEPPAQPDPRVSSAGPFVFCFPSRCSLLIRGGNPQNTPGGGPPCPTPASKPGSGGGGGGGGTGGNGGGANPSGVSADNGLTQSTNFPTVEFGLPSEFSDLANPGTGSDSNSRDNSCELLSPRPAAAAKKSSRSLRSPGDTSDSGCGDELTLLGAGQGTIDKLRPNVHWQDHEGGNLDFISINTYEGGVKMFRRHPLGEYFPGRYTQDGQSTPGPVRFLGINGENGVVVVTPPATTGTTDFNVFPIVEYYSEDGSKWTFFGFLDESNVPVNQSYLTCAGLDADAADLLQGQLWKIEKPDKTSGSITLYTGDDSNPVDAAIDGFVHYEIVSTPVSTTFEVMRPLLMKNSAGLEYHYDYEDDIPRRLHSITMRDAEESVLRTTTFQYYDEKLKAAAVEQTLPPPTMWPVDDASYSGPIEFPGRGTYGDLRLITVETPTSTASGSEDPAPTLVEQTYFRYYTSAEPEGDSIHLQPENVSDICHEPKAQVGPEGLRRAMQELGKTVDQLETIPDDELVKYATAWYQPFTTVTGEYGVEIENAVRFLSRSGCGCNASTEPQWSVRQSAIQPSYGYEYFQGMQGTPFYGFQHTAGSPAISFINSSLLYRPDGTAQLSMITESQQSAGQVLLEKLPGVYKSNYESLEDSDSARNWQGALTAIDPRGRVVETYSPSAVTDLDSFIRNGNFDIEPSSGIVTTYDYKFTYPGGLGSTDEDDREYSLLRDRLPYFPSSVSVSKGTGGSASLLSQTDYDTGDDVDDNPLYRATIKMPPTSVGGVQVEAAVPLPLAKKRFQNGSDSEDVTYEYDMWTTGGGDPDYLVKKVTAKTKVTTAHNGSNSFNLTTQYLYRDKKPAFSVSADGRWTYYEYNGAGQLSRRIDDVMRSYPTDAALTAAFSAFSITPSSVLPTDGEHIVTTVTYDGQGRVTRRTLPTPSGGTQRAEEYRYFKTHDGRKVTIGVPLVTGTSSFAYYGPVSYRVENLAGKVEVEAELELVGGTTSHEPTACYPGDTCSNQWLNINGSTNVVSSVNSGIAKVSRLRVNIYSTSGEQLMESRVYHTIPEDNGILTFSADWDTWLLETGGTSPSYADITRYQYDPMGRLARVEDPTGTVTRTVYDFRGLPIETWVGTDDKLTTMSGSPWPIGNGRTTAPGSPASGFNMTKIASYEYVPGEGMSDGWLTKKIEYAGDGSDRVTQYLRDYRGRVIVEQHLDPTTSDPLADMPRILRKYDLQGRVIAEATYSDSAMIAEEDDVVTDEVDETDPLTNAEGRLSLKELFYDERGQVWKTVVHRINQSTGAIETDASNALTSLFRYDPVGRLIKTVGTSLSKVRHDRLGRVLRQWTLAADGTGISSGHMGTYSSDYGSYTVGEDTLTGTLVSGDVVLELRQNVYEQQTGNVIGSINVSRSQAEPTSWTLSTLGTMGDLHVEDDPTPTSVDPADVKGRLQLATYFYDAWNRRTTTAFYGTAGFTDFDPITPTASTGASPSIPGTEPTASSASVIWSLNAYNNKGELETATDPENKATKTFYDGAGRVIKTVRNYVNGTAGGGTYDDQDQIVEYAYTAGLLTSMTALNESGQTGSTTPQTTSYVYGTTKGSLGSGSPPASLIATGHLLRETIYPIGVGGSGDRTVFVAYNALGEAAWTKDQLGNIIETARDHAGRITATHASTLGSAYNASLTPTGMTDDDVHWIKLTYEDRGLIEKVTQYASNGTTARDQVKYAYDDYGMLTEIRQHPTAAINGSTPDGYVVSYTNARAAPSSSTFLGRQSVRRTEMTLPGATTGSPKPHNASAVVSYDFGIAGDLNDLVGRVENVNLRGDVEIVEEEEVGIIGAAEYSYLGAAVLAGSDLTVPGYTNRMFADGPTATNTSVVTGLDRFNRVKESRWGRAISGPADWYAYRTNVNYDAASSIVSTQDRVVPRTDVKYTNDDLHRLIAAQEGKLASGTISNQNFKQNWSLSLTGNWLSFDETVGSGGTATRTETRSNNAVNEIASRVVDGGSSVSFVYNPAGQLVDDGEKIYTYDAWGRLRYVHARDGVNDRGDLIEESRYNGLGHRIGYYSDQDLDNNVDGSDPWIYNVYDDSWRIVAVFKAGSAADRPHERYVYHAAGMDGRGSSSYIDDVILRERDDDVLLTGTASESLMDRMYYLQNWRHDVVALVRDNGSIVERPRYSSYGVARTATVADFNHDGVVEDMDFTLFTDSYDGYVVGYTEGGARGAGTEAWAACDLNMDGLVDDTDFGIWYPYYDDYVGVNPGVLSNRSTMVGENVDNRIGYAGYAWSPNSATYNVRHRVYNPLMGSWMTRDPLGSLAGAHLYEYVSQRPIATTDMFGLWPDDNLAPVEPWTYPTHNTPGNGVSTAQFSGCMLLCMLGMTESDVKDLVHDVFQDPTLPPLIREYLERVWSNTLRHGGGTASNIITLIKMLQGAGIPGKITGAALEQATLRGLIPPEILQKYVDNIAKRLSEKLFGHGAKKIGGAVVPLFGVGLMGMSVYEFNNCLNACQDGKYEDSEVPYQFCSPALDPVLDWWDRLWSWF